MVRLRGIPFLHHLICVFRASSIELRIDLDACWTGLASDIKESLAEYVALMERIRVI